MIIGEVMNAMYNLLQECSEEKGWQKPTIETIQGNFRTLEYIAWLEKKLDYYKRLAGAADKYIMVKARNEMIVDTGRQLTDEEHDQQYQAFTEYTSILQERKSATGENIEEVVK